MASIWSTQSSLQDELVPFEWSPISDWIAEVVVNSTRSSGRKIVFDAGEMIEELNWLEIIG